MNFKIKNGFSLVELIIVIAIMGIIAVIAVPNLSGIQKRAQINADLRNAEQIGKALTSAIAEFGNTTVTYDANLASGIVDNKSTMLKHALSTRWWALNDFVNAAADDRIVFDISSYISKDLKPKSIEGGGKFFVRYVSKDAAGNPLEPRVVVLIGNSRSSIEEDKYDGLKSGTNYYDATTYKGAEFGYIGGLELNSTNCGVYNP